jgi:hypothetical protein
LRYLSDSIEETKKGRRHAAPPNHSGDDVRNQRKAFPPD